MVKKVFYILFFSLFFFPELYPQWQWQNPLPFGDPIEDVFFADENNGWMAPDNTTLYKTTNGGNEWEIIYTDILFESIFFIDANKGWGIGRTNQYAGKNSIYHSTDGGKSWDVQLADTTVRFELFFINDKIGWATGDYNGTPAEKSYLFETTDGGLTWEVGAINALRGGDSGPHKGVYFLDSLKGWLVGGLLWGAYTTDGGENWKQDSSLAGIEKIVSVDSHHLWGLSNLDFTVRTTDGGETWNEYTIIDTSTEVRARDIYAVDTNNVYTATNIGFFGSSDGGMNFTLLSNEVMNSITFTNVQEAWGGGVTSYSGLYHSIDGGYNWENIIQTNNEFGFDIYFACDFTDENTGWIVGRKTLIGSGSFIIKTTNGGETWETQYFDSNATLSDIHLINKDTGWAVGGNELVLKTTNGGTNWITKHSITGHTLNTVTFADENHGWTVGGNFSGGTILKTMDSGESWTEVTPTFSIPSCYGLSFSDSLTGWVAAGTGSSNGMILKTSDGGINWSVQRESFGMYFDAMDFVTTDSGWAAGYDPITGSDVIFTSDGGISWTGQLTVFSALHDIEFVNSNNGWTAGRTGIYTTTNGGKNWIQQDTYSTQRMTGIDLIDENVGWAVGWYGTILFTENGGTTTVDSDEEINQPPNNFVLYPNYPNPFNPLTKIKFEIPVSSFVTLKIYDVLGRELKVLVNEYKTSGMYEIEFDGTKHASGIYFYRLQSEDYVRTKKMLLLK